MRPEGWEELGDHPCGGDGCLQCRDYANKEAGADAMLEGLMTGVRYRVVAEYVDGQEQTIDSKNGYLVFIEE